MEVDFKYLENVHNLDNDITFLPERIKIKKVEKLTANLHDKEKYVIQFKTRIIS